MPKKPCRVCKKWFEPHPRAGSRQTVCSTPDCQRVRNQRACARWRKANPDWDRDRRLRDRITNHDAPPEARSSRKLLWGAVQHAVGLEVRVVLEESMKHVDMSLQHTVGANRQLNHGVLPKVLDSNARRPFDTGGPEP